MDFPPKQITKLWDWDEGAWGTYVSRCCIHTCSVVVGEIPTLTHELGNDTVERGTLVSKAHFAYYLENEENESQSCIRKLSYDWYLMVERALHHRYLRSIIFHHSHLCRERGNSQQYGGPRRHEVQKWFDQRLLLQPTYIIWIQWIEICVSRATSETIAHYQLRST